MIRKQAHKNNQSSRSKQSFRIGVLLGSGFAVLTVLLYVAIPRQPQVVQVVPTSRLDDQYRPLDELAVFDPDLPFYVAVQLEDYRPGQPIEARWIYEGEVITYTSLETNTTGSGWAGFELRNDNPPWPQGLYSVEITWKDQVLGRTSFRVE